MSRSIVAACILLTTLLAAQPLAAKWGAAKSPAIAGADGYVVIPGAAIKPQAGQVFKAIFDSNKAADKPTQLVPGLNMAGSELNALAVEGLPPTNAKFVVVFHGPAMDGLLKDAAYKAKFGVPNPNLKALAAMKKAGVELYVCGQNLAAENWDPKTLTPDVTVATDALIVLMTYQARGYSLMSF